MWAGLACALYAKVQVCVYEVLSECVVLRKNNIGQVSKSTSILHAFVVVYMATWYSVSFWVRLLSFCMVPVNPKSA